MHKFLRQPVFRIVIKKEELEKICKDIEEKPDTIKVAEDSEGNEFAELCHQFGDFFGLTLRGTYRKMTHLRWIITIRIFWHNVIHKRTGRSGKTCGKRVLCGDM